MPCCSDWYQDFGQIGNELLRGCDWSQDFWWIGSELISGCDWFLEFGRIGNDLHWFVVRPTCKANSSFLGVCRSVTLARFRIRQLPVITLYHWINAFEKSPLSPYEYIFHPAKLWIAHLRITTLLLHCQWRILRNNQLHQKNTKVTSVPQVLIFN